MRNIFDIILENLKVSDNKRTAKKSFDFTSCTRELSIEKKVDLMEKFNKIEEFVKAEVHRLQFVSDPAEKKSKKAELEKTIITVLNAHSQLKYMKKIVSEKGDMITLGSVCLDVKLTDVVTTLLNGKSGTITNHNGENLGMLCVDAGYPGLALLAMENPQARIQQDCLGYNILNRCVTHYAFLPNKNKEYNENFITTIMHGINWYSECTEQMVMARKNTGMLCAERMDKSPKLVACFEKALKNPNARMAENDKCENMMDIAVKHGYDKTIILEKFGYNTEDLKRRQYEKHVRENLPSLEK